MLSAWVPGPKTYKGEVYRLVDPFRYVVSYFNFVQEIVVPGAKVHSAGISVIKSATYWFKTVYNYTMDNI